MAGGRLDIGEALAEAGRRIAVRKGEQATLLSRKDRLDREVGLAKGRLAQKPKVDLFLEELQAEAHARRVGDFEKLLTALVLEVLPGEKPIGLDLEVERGQPSLDIVSRITAEWSEDIYEDQGGALTNIVVLGLRMIAVVRSGMRRFLVLDESDCWVKGERVPTFYGVVKDAARKVGVQCFVISHHDVASFSEGIDVARLHGNPERREGVEVENCPRPYKWGRDEDGIRWIRLRNFQGYVDQTVSFGPGVNALTGDNNIGKSSFVRALRAVFYGETRDRLIRRGETRCEVEIGLPGGRVLHWDRQSRRNPVNVWKLLGEDGAVVSGESMTYETGGRTVPEWVQKIAGIGPVEGLDVHITKQKSPVFLLDKPGSVRASVLSVGQESGHIRKMIALHKERCLRDAATVKEGEAEMSALLRRMESLQRIGAAEERLGEARDLGDAIVRREADAGNLSAALERLADAAGRAAAASARAGAYGRLPEAGELRSAADGAKSVRDAASALETLETSRRDLSAAKARKAALSGLPESVPQLLDCSAIEAAADTLSQRKARVPAAAALARALSGLPAEPALVRSDETIRAGKSVKDAKARLAAASASKVAFGMLPSTLPELSGSADGVLDGLAAAREALDGSRLRLAAAQGSMDECRKDLDALMKEMGDRCPLCSQKVDGAEAFLHVRSHEGEAVHV